MRWLWSEWGGKRSRSQTRPRVARAVQVARLAQGAAMHAGAAGEGSRQMPQATLGSAYADTRAVTFFAPEVAPTSGVLYWEAGQTGWVRGDARERQNIQSADVKSNHERGALRSEAATMNEAGVAVNNAEAKAKRRAQRGLSATLLRAAAEVAQALGRSPEEALAEALQAWLESQESLMQPAVVPAGAGVEVAPRHRPMEVRRQEAWEEIDATLKALRAS